MYAIKKPRRYFLKNTLIGAAALTSYSVLSACSTFDDYLFESGQTFNEEVVIIGGGIGGLYLAQKLRVSKTEFRLYEGSNFFGGRIKSYLGSDYGASILSINGALTNQLLKDLSLSTNRLDKNFIYLSNGMQDMPNALFDRVIGLLPYRNFKLRWKLIEVQKYSFGFELTFQNPTGQKRINCKKMALAIPPLQWHSVKGLLSLPEMNWAEEWLKSLKVENTIKLILPTSAYTAIPKPYSEISIDGLSIRQIYKKNKDSSTVEIDVKYTEGIDISMNNIFSILKKNLNVEYSYQNLSVEQFYDWSQVKLIKGSSFKNSKSVPESSNSDFQIVGDFAALKSAHTIEGALQSAKLASELLL